MEWFGYKLHLAVDTANELPMALSVTPAHVNDCDVAPTLMEQVAAGTKVKFFVLDAGYDQLSTECSESVQGRRIVQVHNDLAESSLFFCNWYDASNPAIL